MDFSELKLSKALLNALADLNFVKPTPIQSKGIPAIKSGKDIIGIAQTGTGKTAAYLLPTLMKLNYAQGNDPRALILVPTKELVLQVKEQIEQLTPYTDLRNVALYGGVGKQAQIKALEEGVDIIVSTPRRFVELYELGSMRAKGITTLILDEADRMLDMGFTIQINLVFDVLVRKKQILLFSATFSKRVETLTNNFLDFPLRIEVAPESSTVDTIKQTLFKIPNRPTKIKMLEVLLKDYETFNRVMVFCRTKKNANAIYKHLHDLRYGPIKVIHSNKDQHARMNAMRGFKEGEVRILVTTDVSARGIDVSMVSHVINFDVPVIYQDYVHRVGRTGRAENEGIAYTLVNPAEMYHLRKIQKLIQKEIPEMPIPPEVEVIATSFEEEQEMALAIDNQKRKDDPNYKGAFHARKSKADKKEFAKKPKRGRKKFKRP